MNEPAPARAGDWSPKIFPWIRSPVEWPKPVPGVTPSTWCSGCSRSQVGCNGKIKIEHVIFFLS